MPSQRILIFRHLKSTRNFAFLFCAYKPQMGKNGKPERDSLATGGKGSTHPVCPVMVYTYQSTQSERKLDVSLQMLTHIAKAHVINQWVTILFGGQRPLS